MSKTITFNVFDRASIDRAIAEVKAYKSEIDAKLARVMDALSHFGQATLNVYHAEAVYDGVDTATSMVVQKDNGFELQFFGESVLFIEYGAGVYYNPGGVRTMPDGTEYSGEIPADVVPIGEYGKGYGKRKGWFFTGAFGKEYTHGNPANAPMLRTAQEMKNELIRLLKEEFK